MVSVETRKQNDRLRIPRITKEENEISNTKKREKKQVVGTMGAVVEAYPTPMLDWSGIIYTPTTKNIA